MSGLLREFDPESADEETRRLSRLAQECWSPLAIVYDPLKAGSIDSTDIIPHDKAIIKAQSAKYVVDQRIKGKPECTVFVGNLNAKTSERSLKNEFSRYGRVMKATVVQDIITGRSRGYGFIEFSLEGEAAKAYEHAHHTWLDGNKVIVDMECSRLLPGWIPRRMGGGFNGRKESGQLRFGCRERPFRKPIKLLTEREIKEVFEKTMGRKLSVQESGSTDQAAGNSVRMLETVRNYGDSQLGKTNPGIDEPFREKAPEDQASTKSGTDSLRDEGNKDVEEASDVDDKKSRKDQKRKHHDKKKKRKRRRSRSSNESSDDGEEKTKHRKRRKEHKRKREDVS